MQTNNDSVFGNFKPTNTNMLVFFERGSNPPKFILYDSFDVEGCKARIARSHPELVFLGVEVFLGADEARKRAAAFNFAMQIYKPLLVKYQDAISIEYQMDRDDTNRDKLNKVMDTITPT